MKQKLFTLLCGILLIACMTGCKKKEEQPFKESFPNPWGQESMDDGSKMGQITSINGNTIIVATMGGFGMGREDFEGGEMPEMPEGGEFPGRPEGGEFPGRPEGGEFPGRPEGGEIPEMPEGGEFPGRPEGGEMPRGESLTVTITENTAITLSDGKSGNADDLSTDNFIRFTVDDNNNALTVEIIDMSKR